MNGLLLIGTVTVFMVALLMMLDETAAGPNVAQSIVDAHARKEKVANPTSVLPDLDFEQAYDLQTQVVNLEADKRGGRAGYKAAMTSEAAQKKFGVDGPTYGVLMNDMLLESGVEIDTSDFGPMLLEVEIAMFLDRDINAPLADVAEAKAAVAAVAPAIEIPESRLADPGKAKAVDVVSDNANANRVILGSKMDLASIDDINQIKTRLTKDGRTISEGVAMESSGDQYKTLMWLVESVTARGGNFKKGQVIITGALGPIPSAVPGQYHSEYGPLGELDFVVK